MDRKNKEDTYSYRGWLNSDRFIKRAFAILGYGTIAYSIASVIILIFAFFTGIGGSLL